METSASENTLESLKTNESLADFGKELAALAKEVKDSAGTKDIETLATKEGDILDTEKAKGLLIQKLPMFAGDENNYYELAKKIVYKSNQDMPIIECALLHYGDVGKTEYKGTIYVKIPVVSGTVTAELAQIRTAGKTKVDFIGSADVNDEWIASFIDNTTFKDNIHPGDSHWKELPNDKH